MQPTAWLTAPPLPSHAMLGIARPTIGTLFNDRMRIGRMCVFDALNLALPPEPFASSAMPAVNAAVVAVECVDAQLAGTAAPGLL